MKTLLACCIVLLPLKNLTLTSGYGFRIHPVTGRNAFHAGIDLRARHDTVFAVMDGTVAATGYDNLLGIYIRLSHGVIETGYGHLSAVLVLPGEIVQAGEPIGITGATGRVTGEHLHFSVRYCNTYLDPLKFLYQLLIQKTHE